MEKLTIKKSTDIQASREKIWDVLTTDENTRIWFSEFGAGTYAITDWQVGSKAIFMDESESGLIGTIVANDRGQELTIDYHGVVTEGKEDFESDLAKSMIGYRENYRLTPTESGYTLHIESDMGDEYFEFMSEAWNRALVKIKSLAEES